MFERFDEQTRQVVQNAPQEAHSLRQGFIGTEHLLLSLASVGTGVAAEALAAFGVQAASLRTQIAASYDDPLDAQVLSSLGIDLEAVRRATEAAFGQGALDRRRSSTSGRNLVGHKPLTPDAKKSLELALREAHRLGHNSISCGHLLLGILRAGDNTAVRVLTGAGVDVQRLREDVIQRMATAA